MQGVDTVDTFQMKSGVTAGSRFGLKGTEDLGNGLKIGFVLENGFSSDTGSFTQDNRLFGREAQLNLSGAFGTVAFGRMGSLASGNGTFGLLGSMSPFGTSWGQYAANASTVMSGFDRYDNTVTYATPAFAGFKVYAQYSFDTDTKDDYDGAGLSPGIHAACSIAHADFKHFCSRTAPAPHIGIALRGGARPPNSPRFDRSGPHGQNC